MTSEIRVEPEETPPVEVGYALIGRAQDIHGDPDDSTDAIAQELKDEGNRILSEYE